METTGTPCNKCKYADRTPCEFYTIQGDARKMNVSTACKIFKEIESNKYTDEEKGVAIYEVLRMPTHNGITKNEMLVVINFLLRLAYYYKDRPIQFDRITESPEALADFIVSGGKCNKCIIEGCVCDKPNACYEGILKYLKSEVPEMTEWISVNEQQEV